MKRLGRFQHLESGAAAHLQVADDDVEEAFVQLLDRRVAVRRFLDVMAGLGHGLSKPSAQRIVVVGDQNVDGVIIQP